MQAHLADFEGQLRLVFDSSPSLVFFKDEELNYTTINSAMAAFIGKPAAELIGLSDRDLYCAEVAQKLEDLDRRALQTGRIEVAITRPSNDCSEAQRVQSRAAKRISNPSRQAASACPFCAGSSKDFSAVRIALTDRTGATIGVLGIDRPLSGEPASQPHNRTADRIQPLVDSSPLAVIEWNPNHQVVSWMGGAEKMFGWKASEVVGKRVDQWPIVFEEDWVEVHKAQLSMREGLSSVSKNRNYRKDGAVIYCEWYNSAVVDADGNLSAALSVVLETTSRVKAEQALRKSEERFRDLFETAPTGIFQSTLDGRFIWLNPRMAAIFGYLSAEDMKQSIIDIGGQLFFDPSQRGMVLQKALAADSFVNTEVNYVRCDGSPLLTTLYIRAVRDEQRQPMYLEGFVEDITEQRKAEEEVRQAHAALERRVQERTIQLSVANEQLKELDRLKSQFLASMSHELRTPLNSIIGFTSLLRRGLSGTVTDEQVKQLTIVHNCSKHLLDLINDLLDVSTIEAGRANLQIQTFDLAEVVSEVVSSLKPIADRKALHVSFQVIPDRIFVTGDRKRTLQVILNLVNNAIKFTDRGSVHVEAECLNNTLRVSVVDTGIGIKPEQFGKLFEAFRQLDGSARRVYEGTGLGLYLSRKLLHLMGGDIQVQSEYGKGSRFAFELPVHCSYSESGSEAPT